MKHSDSTEMDRLLRRYARSNGETVRGEDHPGVEATARTASATHLDADEMNAYAENALPESARSRYFAHLADCDSCRKLVTDLTLAASITHEGRARVASLEATPSRSWREWLAAIFSPPVLRYGVPALALFAIVIVAIVAIRTQKQELSVAQNKESEYSAPPAGTSSNSAAETRTSTRIPESHSNSNGASIDAEQRQQQPGVAATPSDKTEAVEGDGPIISQDQVARPPTAKAGDLKDASREDEVAGKRAQEEAAATPAPSAPVLSAPAQEPVNRDMREEQKKAKAAGKDDDEAAASRNSVGGRIAKQTETNEDRPNAGGITAGRRAQNLPRTRQPTAPKSGATSDKVGEKERSAETRSVGGRRFQREGSAWVDTAYDPSRPTTNVRRGSEQYRGLIADEPGLRTIVEQLGGEVRVVWKSRAYRFY